MALPEPAEYDALPTVTVLRSRPVASFKDHGSIWEIGWNGIWVKRWARAIAAPEKPDVAIAPAQASQDP